MCSVANMLDRLYKEFDGLSNKYDIFKVETIGDGESDPGWPRGIGCQKLTIAWDRQEHLLLC